MAKRSAVAVLAAALPAAASADALDDDFEVDADLVADEAQSDAEDANAEASTSRLPAASRAARARINTPNGEDEDEFDMNGGVESEANQDNQEEEEDAEENDEHGLPLKRRKLETPSKDEPNVVQAAENRKRKRREKLREAKRKKFQNVDLAEQGAETSMIAEQPPSLQADFIAEMQSIALPGMSSLENDDLHIGENCFIDTTHITSRKSLAAFLTAATSLQQDDFRSDKRSAPGSPVVLAISGAALRVADVVRDLRTLPNVGEIAKLFAKHFKLAEHCSYCTKTKFGIGAGTPDRVLKLIEADALLLSDLQYVVLDMTRDSKKRNLLDIPESRGALFKLLKTSRINGRLKEGKLKLIMY